MYLAPGSARHSNLFVHVMRQTSCARNEYGYAELPTLLTCICVYIICARAVGCIYAIKTLGQGYG